MSRKVRKAKNSEKGLEQSEGLRKESKVKKSEEG